MKKENIKNIKVKIDEVLEKKEEIWKKLMEEHKIEKELDFNEINISEKIKKIEFLILHFHDLFVNEKAKFDVLESELESLIGKRYDFYRFDFDKSLTPKEIEKYYLPKDEEILEFKKLLMFQNFRVEFFDTICKLLNKRQWNMKNFIDICKIGL